MQKLTFRKSAFTAESARILNDAGFRFHSENDIRTTVTYIEAGSAGGRPECTIAACPVSAGFAGGRS